MDQPTLSSVAVHKSDAPALERITESILTQVILAPSNQLGYMLDANHTSVSTIFGNEMVKDAGQITGSTADVQHASPRLEEGQEVLCSVGVL
jgi:hypothetical protein